MSYELGLSIPRLTMDANYRARVEADARLGAALRENWPVVDDALTDAVPSFDVRHERDNARDALAPLIEQAKDGAT